MFLSKDKTIFCEKNTLNRVVIYWILACLELKFASK